MPLGEAALAAGFGSYAQFHRVFRKLRDAAPRDYLAPPAVDWRKNASPRMPSRRRIDWPEIIGPEAARPVWKKTPARSETVTLLRAFAPLFHARHPDDLAKHAVELALEVVGLVRAGVYFYDDRLDLMVGTWGTDLRQRVIDEHYAMFRLGERGRWEFARAMSGEALWTVVEDCPIIVNDATARASSGAAGPCARRSARRQAAGRAVQRRRVDALARRSHTSRCTPR